MDWDRLRIFHTVAEAGSFTAAGARLGLSQSAASRQIKALEDDLGVSLFTRHARGLVLTQEGRQLFQTAGQVVRQLEETERSLRESKATPSGKIRVTTMVTFGAVWLTPHLKSFMDAYPEIDIELILSDSNLDLATGEADVAIRLGEGAPPDQIQRPLTVFHAHAYASPDYLHKRGMPGSLSDVHDHDLIRFGAVNAHLTGLDWLFEQAGPTPKARLAVNNLYGVLHAVEAGMGIAVLPDYLVHQRKKLVRLFPDTDSPTYDSFFCYPQELRGSLRLTLFRDFLLQAIREESNIL